jgi:hypothetical protein
MMYLRRSLVGLWMAALAFAALLSMGSAIPAGLAVGGTDPGTPFIFSICQSAHGSGGRSSPVRHSPSTCAICPICTALMQAGVLLPPAPPAMPALRSAGLAEAALPPARAPPSIAVGAAYPRGPPPYT